MYIDPFLCGVISTLLAEALVCAVFVVCSVRNNTKIEEEK